jgi:hypothetical protein
MTPTDWPIAVVSRSTSSKAFGSSFIAPTTRSPKVIRTLHRLATAGRAQCSALTRRAPALGEGAIHCPVGHAAPQLACDNYSLCLVQGSRNPGDIRRSRAPARSTAPIAARSRSPSRKAASSRSTADAKTQAPRATSAGRSADSPSGCTVRTDCSTRRFGRNEGRRRLHASPGTRHWTHRRADDRDSHRSGGEAILPFCYGGSNGLTQDTNDATLWRAFGTSRLARTVCAARPGPPTWDSTARCLASPTKTTQTPG